MFYKGLTRLYLQRSTSVCFHRSASTTASSNATAKFNEVIDLYNSTKESATVLSSKINPKGVFVNNELDLSEIDIYGFDYDYTLAYYNKNIFKLIFNLARDILITKYKYPKELESLTYTSTYPIRGLHFDKRNGWFMKIDSYHNIQLGTVYYGMNQVSDDDVKKFYGGTHVRIDDIGYTQTSLTMHQFIDLFCLPEIYLIASIIDYFNKNSIQFSPDYIFNDVQETISLIHTNESLHLEISKSINDYILPRKSGAAALTADEKNYEECEKLREILLRLKKSGKNIFLITNSKFWFVNIGMSVLFGKSWQHLFDVIVCQARKPSFFTSTSKPFREYIHDDDKTVSSIKTWKPIRKFEPHKIYTEGNLYQLLEFTNWSNKKILYFGDNLYSDLVQPFLKYGWRTAAIINELKYEIENLNKIEYQQTVSWLVKLEALIQQLMLINETHLPQKYILEKYILEKTWMQERDALRKVAKNTFNPYFGSLFRTYNNPTFFSRRLSRFADIYTSNLTNLLEYPVNYHFIPRRLALAHEHVSHATFDKIDSKII